MPQQFAKGLWVALVTPMAANGDIDYDGLKRLVERHVKAGTNGLVPCGTTGESATMSEAEHEKVIGTVIEAAQGRLEVMAGTGSNSTRKAEKLTKFAQQEGATGALVVTPYYNKPTQNGLIAHFSAVAAAAPDLPICLYNVPARTGVDMLPETSAKLASDFDSIVALKEASGKVERVSASRCLNPNLDIYSGDDALTVAMLALGARGVISVLGNVIPEQLLSLLQAWFQGNLTKARDHHERLFPLMKALFLETNPIPIKCLMSKLGWLEENSRLPLLKAENSTAQVLADSIAKLKIQTKLASG